MPNGQVGMTYIAPVYILINPRSAVAKQLKLKVVLDISTCSSHNTLKFAFGCEHCVTAIRGAKLQVTLLGKYNKYILSVC